MDGGAPASAPSAPPSVAVATLTLVAKHGGRRIELLDLPAATTTVGRVKDLLRDATGVLPKRQKLIGLKGKKGVAVGDDTPLSDLKVKGGGNRGGDGNGGSPVHRFILMGTPEEGIFVDPSERAGNLPDVVDDFDLDFNAGSDEWVQHKAKEDNLQKFTESTDVHIIHPPRTMASPGGGDNDDGAPSPRPRPLLVLDLDHTLLDFSSRTLREDGGAGVAADVGREGDAAANRLKRPYMDEFLTWTYKYYDLVVWSQTSWRWLEVKLTELGMLTHPGYKFCFVLDKTSMFRIVSTSRSGRAVTHHVKPLQIIWSKFPRWDARNTVHLDDLSRNFALNPGSGLKCTAYHRKRRTRGRLAAGGKDDGELLGLGRFLELLATNEEVDGDFESVDFQYWQDYVSGKREFRKKG